MRFWRRERKLPEGPLTGPLTYPMPPVPPEAAFMEATWTCGGCGRRWAKRFAVDQPTVTIACPVCDVGNPAAMLVQRVYEEEE